MNIPRPDPLTSLASRLSELPPFRFEPLEFPSFRPQPFGEPHIPTATLKEITFTYYRLLSSYTGYNEDLCTPCQNPKPTTYFCSHHAFHLPCLVNQVYACSQHLVKKITSLRTNHIRSSSLYHFGQTYSHSTYTLTIPEKNLPCCPNCRRTEGMVRLEAKVVDRGQGPLETAVEIEKDPDKPYESLSHHFFGLKIFDKLTTVLTTFKAFLSYVQNATPALAGRIFAVQKSFLIGDVAIVARNCFLLHPLITQKLTAIDPNTWYKKHAEKIVIAGIAVLGLATIAAVYAINCYFQLPIDPQEVLKNILISDLGSVSCKWSAIPLMQQISQFVIISRIVSELALAYFSKERLRYLSHAILQIFTLFNVSQLQWLDFERTIPNPLKTLFFTIKDSSSKSDIEYYQKIVEKIWMKFTILIPGNTSASGLQSMINSVYEYSSNLFKNSNWDGYTISQYSSVSRITYEIQLALSRLEFPYIEKISALITTNLGWQGIFTTIPTLIFHRPPA